MNNPNQCPQCNSENAYPDGNIMVCPECNHEWDPNASKAASEEDSATNAALDAHGNVLKTGDSVTLIKDLKVKGSASGIKAGTKVKNIRIVEGDDGHNIACKVDGIGAMYLKSEFVKKA
jgi:protein PhnA